MRKLFGKVLKSGLVWLLALTLSLALPTMAAVNWDDFRITKQPQNLTIKQGDSFTLSVEVNVPTEVEIEYQWRCFGEFIENATTPDLHLSPDDPDYPKYEPLGGISTSYECWITARGRDSENNVVSRNLYAFAKVTTERSSLGKLADVTIAPFGYAFTMVVTSPAFALIFPISFLGCLIYFYVKGFMGLF